MLVNYSDFHDSGRAGSGITTQKGQGTLRVEGPISVFQPSCCFALVPPNLRLLFSYKWTILTAKASIQGFNVSLAVRHFVRNLVWQK
jgi:hypothetical protein